MKPTPLNNFVEKVMHISNGFAGMGNASSVVLGAANPGDQVVRDLRKHTLAFAAEYTKARPDHKKLVTASQHLQGSLQVAKLFHGLSDEKLEELSANLDSLLDRIHAK
jgi:hypothetical protein